MRYASPAFGGPKQLGLLCTAKMLQPDFAGADALELLEEESDWDEGQLHRGRAAMVRGVFRKK